jgi:hypothetical protein
VIGLLSKVPDWLGVAAELVGDHNPWLAIARDQLLEETPGCFCIAPPLHENIQHVTIGVDRSPQPMVDAVDHDDDLVQMPLVIRLWSTAGIGGLGHATRTG